MTEVLGTVRGGRGEVVESSVPCTARMGRVWETEERRLTNDPEATPDQEGTNVAAERPGRIRA